ncbi:glutamine amidotransferase-related protein [Serinibacter arcticus]|uniref:Glutamine amidotransferase class-I n=1 Tax=Serinibacter arcticus TaxID=1655435 RepID=A0A4Z1E744_9MICO|nr:gamma-glutamyl-gamma-aminobutyrate hydrolase family protein [Serinibacter arcticus]TGO06522.1 Glutamine amidotransferase class-I [Serinibacter arcticus]
MSSPTALVLRHDVGIGLGNVAATLTSRGYVVTTLDTPTADLAEVDPLAWDVVIALGGAEGAYETDLHPHLAREIELLTARAAARRPILGICLGAQMLAVALGARAWRGPVHEVGFLPLAVTEAGTAGPVRHVIGVPMMQWHHDTFDLPDGVDLLATSASYPQAYAIGSWLLAVQFHPEVDEAIVDGWIERWQHEVTDVPGASAAELLAAKDTHLDAAQAASRALVGEWLDGLARSGPDRGGVAPAHASSGRLRS